MKMILGEKGATIDKGLYLLISKIITMDDTNMNQSGRSDETNFDSTDSIVSATELQEALSGIEFPASRQDLVDQANDNGADQSVISALETLPDREYHAVTEVQQAFSGAQA